MSSSPLDIGKLTDHLFRHEAGKMVSVLTKIFGTENLETAEDVVQQTFIDAMNNKQLNGIVVQNPFNMGYLGVKTMVDHLNGRNVEKTTDTGVTLVTPDNLNSADIQTLLHPPLDQYLK